VPAGGSRYAGDSPRLDAVQGTSILSSQLPAGRDFFRGFTIRFGLVGVGAAALILTYMAALLRLPPEPSRALWWTVGAIAIGLTPLFNIWQRRLMAGLLHCLDRCAEGNATDAELRIGFATAIDLPRRCALFCVANYGTATLLAVVVMYLRFDDFTLNAGILMMAAGLSGGLLANVITFFVLKRILHPICCGLADRLPDPEVRDQLVRRVPLVRKIAVGLTMVALVPVVFSVFLAQSRASSSAEAIAMRLQRAVFARAAEAVSEAGDIDGTLAGIELEASRFGVVARLQRVSREGGSGTLTDDERNWILDANTESGDAESLHSENIVSWQHATHRGKPLLIAATTPRLDVGGQNLAWMYALVVACAAAVALLVAWLMARDVGQATGSLEEQASRVASGDLRPAQLLESEDELGGVGRAFARMTSALRTTVGRVVATANRVETTGSTISDVAQRVADSARAQAHGTQQCVESVVAAQTQAQAITESARKLLTSTEESSSSVLEMSAAGEQMHETATLLSAKVDEVAASIEESTRSIGEVNGNTAALSSAAEETSASMEEMAAAMRQVDATAEETARLSGDVALAAETGQRKVRETVHGMESIRNATESAQQVINGLGDRALRIGAVLEVINDIANRTNLLALNASIIAAQAGEHGRAFSVVGNEIAELATRVRSSTEEIGGLIRSVQQEAENAIGAIRAGSERVASGVALANEAGTSLDGITQAARRSGERSREIVAAVREQSKAAGHVVGMMEQVSDGLGAIRRATEEQSRGHSAISDAATSMRDVAQQLRATTEEQARGVRQIRESVEGVRDSAERIHGSVESQTGSCTTSVRLLEELAAHTSANEEWVHQMEEALLALSAESEALRTDANRFQV
jgi:methyl-accepting chemotaxis protein